MAGISINKTFESKIFFNKSDENEIDIYTDYGSKTRKMHKDRNREDFDTEPENAVGCAIFKIAIQDGDPNHIALISAIKNGEFENAREILIFDRENKYVGPLGVLQVTALQMAAWQGNVGLLNQLHGRGADINSKDKIGRCALYYAAYSGNTDVTKWLLAHGGRVNIKIGIYSSETNIPNDIRTANKQYSPLERQLPIPDCKGRTPLHYAVENNHADVVGVLVEHCANVNVEDDSKITPLLLAGNSVNRDDLDEMTKFNEIVRILVGPLGVLQVTALQMAAWQGNIDLLNQLHERGADINSKDKIGRCALYYAAYSGNTDVTKWLLEHGGDVDIKIGIYSFDSNIPYDEYFANMQYGSLERELPIPFCKGRTPLHYAVENNHADVVDVLVEHYANVNVEDDRKITPLLLAGNSVNRNDLDEMTKFNEIVMILVGPLGVLQVTALQMAAWQGNIDLLNQLYERGADINSKDKIGRCALYYAAYSGNTDVTKWLLEHGGDVDIKIGIYSSETNIPYDEYIAYMQYNPLERQLPIPYCRGRTPLHYAVENNHADVVGILAESGANVNFEDKDQITPLLLVGTWVICDNLNDRIKFFEIVRILVNANVRVNATCPRTGNTALHYAAVVGSVEATEILLRDARPDNCNYSGDRPLHTTASRFPILNNIGKTPLHCAVENNHADVVRVLVEGGMDVNVKDNQRITPLLLAGSSVNRDNLNEMTKFVEIVRILVDANAFVDDIDPVTGNTALHQAVMLGSAEATKILSSNARSDNFNYSRKTPLHIAVELGRIKILQVLLEQLPYENIDKRDKDNHTALDIAIYRDNRDCVQALISYGVNLAAVTKTGDTSVSVIFDNISEPVDLLTDALNSCVKIPENNTLEKYKKIIVNFKILAPDHQMQMAVVTAIIAAVSNMKQLAILQHPVVETFLRLKWKRLRIFFFVLILIHLFFAISLSKYALMFSQNDTDHVVTRRIIAICSCIFLLYNTIQIILEPKNYLRQLETWLSIICAMLSLITSIAGEIVKCPKEEIKSLRHCMDWMLHSISIAILLSWMQMMLLISRVLMWGDYALMFYTVLKNILKVLLAFGSLIIGFALSFAVLFHGNQKFHEFKSSIIKTVVMMMGEYEYEKLFGTKNDESTFLSGTKRIVFIVFVIFVSIVLINLMTGLAVNDIQGLEKEGHTRRLMKQAQFVAHLEKVMSHRTFCSDWLPCHLKNFLRSRVEIKTEITLVYNKKNINVSTYSLEPPNRIPVHLKEALFLLVRKSFKNDNLADRNRIGDTTLTQVVRI
ncbi:serine/threonine-protein phosphatase 6 regulatory ankyrin repeat subunit B isoform X2 [Solenopsis invicta]|uniref:serine/threonine-protein phosphatase 6 regulatory ankyrin repeat subunit B isoform X2 n=1 Tax=Solenopsis invicta TaxID=13686 RepID=UPI00193D197E|nr:serine/threonine-protein phosphatase 6 regulatory ankyrin repeat subunit B isoform X2 [Solenopsis invicta]